MKHVRSSGATNRDYTFIHKPDKVIGIVGNSGTTRSYRITVSKTKNGAIMAREISPNTEIIVDNRDRIVFQVPRGNDARDYDYVVVENRIPNERLDRPDQTLIAVLVPAYVNIFAGYLSRDRPQKERFLRRPTYR